MDIATDWSVIGDAMKFYESKGYSPCELPWVAKSETIDLTCPDRRYVITSSIGDLVGSAEQSFIERDRYGGLPPGKYVSCTPCFRNEDEVNWMRQKTFMKVELYDNANVTLSNLLSVISDAVAFFSTQIPSKFLEVVQTPEGYDICCMQIELGSYGIREFPEHGLTWLYGTGVAEPRFSSLRDNVRSILKKETEIPANVGKGIEVTC
jgi:hypothetical protein